MSVLVNSCVHYICLSVCGCCYVHVQRVNEHLFEKLFTDMNTKTLNTYEKVWLWLARRPFGWPRATGKPDPWHD